MTTSNDERDGGLQQLVITARPELMPAEVVTLEEFGRIREERQLGKIVATSGGFDPPHDGHGKNLLAAKGLGDTLVVIVNGDSYLRHKKIVPFMDLETRCASLRYKLGVDFVIPYEEPNDRTVINALRVVRPHIFAKGGDVVNPNTVPEREVLEELGAKLLTGVGGNTKIRSSSQILADYLRRVREQEQKVDS
jgi:D-beta-D-heptose 7-phosphate kinase/D-beta-D-heptose 1-phosphate adenosyltransferase